MYTAVLEVMELVIKIKQGTHILERRKNWTAQKKEEAWNSNLQRLQMCKIKKDEEENPSEV